jgi:DNA-binding transcriptional LysR family regulator
MQTADNPLDAQLLRVLCTLLAERSVTKAAARLNLSQPAASLALKRLREIFGDPLLVRGRDGMVPTERAMRLQVSAEKALAEMDNLLVDPDRFDAGTLSQTFTIALPDYIVPTFMAGVVAEIRRLAPNVCLEIRSLTADFDFEGALASGAVDVVISNWPSPPAYLRTSLLFEDDIVSLVDRNHPFACEAPSAQAFLHAGHIVPAAYSAAHRGVVDTHLLRLRVEREKRVVVSYFTMGPHLVVGTDLVFTTSRHFADYFATILPVAIIKPPFDFPPMRFYQLWHDRVQHSPVHRMFRQVLARNSGNWTTTAASAPGVG